MENESSVLLTVLSRQSFPGAREEKTEYAVPGRLAREGDAFFLTWSEPGEGMGGVTSLLHLEGAAATLSREGPFRSEMVFQAGRRHPFLYRTPYGDLEMVVTTDLLQWSIAGREGDVEISYRLEAGPRETGAILFQIHIRESDTI